MIHACRDLQAAPTEVANPLCLKMLSDARAWRRELEQRAEYARIRRIRGKAIAPSRFNSGLESFKRHNKQNSPGSTPAHTHSSLTVSNSAHYDDGDDDGQTSYFNPIASAPRARSAGGKAGAPSSPGLKRKAVGIGSGSPTTLAPPSLPLPPSNSNPASGMMASIPARESVVIMVAGNELGDNDG